MSTRHPSNPNLRLHLEEVWQGFPVQIQRGSLVVNYLDSINQVIQRAVTEHPRTCVFRCDLNFPAEGYEPDTAVISRFTDSLKAQIKAHEARKLKVGKRVHPCHLRYVWVKERNSSQIWHYHVALFVNRDAYFTLGMFKSMRHGIGNESSEPCTSDTDNTNMSDRIRMAWASALNLNLEDTSGLVHFPKNPTYDLDVNDPEFNIQYADVFYRLSYFAKVETKRFGNGSNSFGCSRN